MVRVFVRYESIIATLCENLDSLDEPDARAAMIWIVGEYAERIDNADELLESFLEGFHDESTQVGFSCQQETPLVDATGSYRKICFDFSRFSSLC